MLSAEECRSNPKTASRQSFFLLLFLSADRKEKVKNHPKGKSKSIFFCYLFFASRQRKVNPFTFSTKRLHLSRETPNPLEGSVKAGEATALRLPQMTDNGLHLGTEEGVATRVVVQRLQLGQQLRTALYPTVKGLHGTLGSAVRMVEQSQFGLAVRTDLKHGF